jgi:hypothetical protein
MENLASVEINHAACASLGRPVLRCHGFDRLPNVSGLKVPFF